MREYIKKEIAFERVLFFSDAIVAIAITLLALDLRIEVPDGRSLQFADLVRPWHQYLAFLLSFVNIAGLWRRHHDFFLYIRKLDDRMLFFNMSWLFLIVVLPFSTSVLSNHFGESPAVFLYSLNIFLLSIFQNCIWDHASDRKEYVNTENLSDGAQSRYRWMLNLDMLNGLIAIIVSFFAPRVAFFILFFRVPLIIIAPFIIAKERKRLERLKK